MLLVARRLLGSSVVNHAVLAQLNGGPAGASTLVGATDTSLVVISLATSGSSAVLCQQHLPFVVLGLQATPMGHTQVTTAAPLCAAQQGCLPLHCSPPSPSPGHMPGFSCAGCHLHAGRRGVC